MAVCVRIAVWVCVAVCVAVCVRVAVCVSDSGSDRDGELRVALDAADGVADERDGRPDTLGDRDGLMRPDDPHDDRTATTTASPTIAASRRGHAVDRRCIPWGTRKLTRAATEARIAVA